ncbi:phosphoribosylglycinamide formyltransferase [Cytobacillus sp. IB215316]|uniref:phosphoribosylglycinamide formyltransferase n=1 Tax=Cytobacillus sp. IB215316 TaxID=3097354 RepID=UPI002A140743|nr:phosphoribosylglycinamide formyltransferase [Cytobacillus sp. IB215316]MDX8362850.1 phosphoribosylglycinamide formyltransferase [Cytobacillus sp. IB215316]
MKNIAVFASGSGTNFQAIVDAVYNGHLEANVKLLVCDKPHAKVIQRAQQANVNVFSFSPKGYDNKESFEKEIVLILKENDVDFIVLAGYMRLVGSTLLSAYSGNIVNIHPSLLPAFPGKDAIGQAFRAGAAKTGVTVHYVDEGMDTGPVIAQEELHIHAGETIESIEERIHQIEHQFYPNTLQKIFAETNNMSK